MVVFIKTEDINAVNEKNLIERLNETINVNKSDLNLNYIILVNNENIKRDDTNKLVLDYNIFDIKNISFVAVNYENSEFLFYSKNEELAREISGIANFLKENNLKKEKLPLKEKPLVTYGIIGINILMYLITAFLSNNILDSDINVLILLGAKVNELILGGEYYRLITCMFLHGGLLHIALNMYALYSIGPLIEKKYGKLKYIGIYFVSGILSSIFSYVLSTSVSIGASGAIFGLFGATLIYAMKNRDKVGKDFLRSIASVIVANLILGFSIANIDNFGHVGGLVGGSLLTFFMKAKLKD